MQHMMPADAKLDACRWHLFLWSIPDWLFLFSGLPSQKLHNWEITRYGRQVINTPTRHLNAAISSEWYLPPRDTIIMTLSRYFSRVCAMHSLATGACRSCTKPGYLAVTISSYIFPWAIRYGQVIIVSSYPSLTLLTFFKCHNVFSQFW